MKRNLNPPMKRALRLKNLFLTACFLLIGTAAFSQEHTVTGVVTDSFKEPLIGVSIVVQGTNTGVVTGLDGDYSIQVPADATLEFSYVGMEKQSIKVGNRNVINVQMKEDSQMLAETVVIGYGSAKKRDLTGSITNIKGDEIANKPVANPLSALQGKVAGVQIINSGKAGADPEIRVRGTNSINGYKPLYVVDGLFNDNINFLNPQDIESMEILKDPSSLAIFGVRGANGVIIITTKKAKEGQTRVNINGSFGFKAITNKIAMVDADGFKLLYNEQLRNEGNPEYDFSDWTGNTNWQDEIFQTGFITNNNISITGASDKHSFYLGAGYAYEQGNIKHEKYSKITLNISNDYKVTDNFKVGFQFNGARMLPADSKSVATALRAAPVAEVYNKEYGLYTSLPGFQKAQMNNPMVDVDLKANTTKAENYRGSGNIYGQWDFLKHFQFKAMFSLDYASNNTRTYTPIIKVYDASAEGDIATLGTGKTGVTQAKETEMKVQSDYLLTYTNSWGDHSLTATAGFTTYYNKLENLNAGRTQGVGLIIPDNPDKWYVSIGDANRIRVEHLHPKNAQNRTSGSAQCDARLQHATGSAGTNRQQGDNRLRHETQQQNRQHGQIGLRGETQLRGGAAIAHHLRHDNRHNARQQAGERHHPQNARSGWLVFLRPLGAAAEQRAGGAKHQSGNQCEHHVVGGKQAVRLANQIERVRALDQARHP